MAATPKLDAAGRARSLHASSRSPTCGAAYGVASASAAYAIATTRFTRMMRVASRVGSVRTSRPGVRLSMHQSRTTPSEAATSAVVVSPENTTGCSLR